MKKILEKELLNILVKGKKVWKMTGWTNSETMGGRQPFDTFS